MVLAGRVAGGGSPHSMGVTIQTERKTKEFLGEEGLTGPGVALGSTVGTMDRQLRRAQELEILQLQSPSPSIGSSCWVRFHWIGKAGSL